MRKNLSLGFPIRSDTNWAVQPQMMVGGMNFEIKEVDVHEAKTKALISCTFTSQLSAFSHMRKTGFLTKRVI